MITRTWKRSVLEALNGSYSQCSSFRWGIEAFSASLSVGVVKWCMMLGPPPTRIKGATSLSQRHHWVTEHQTWEAYKDRDVKRLWVFWEVLPTEAQHENTSQKKSTQTFDHCLLILMLLQNLYDFRRTQNQKLSRMFLLLFSCNKMLI